MVDLHNDVISLIYDMFFIYKLYKNFNYEIKNIRKKTSQD